MRVSLVLVALAVAVAACASDEASVSTTTSVDTSPTSTSLVSTTTIPEPMTTTSTTPSGTATTTPEIDVEFVDGEVIGPDVFEVGLGQSLDVWIRSDVDDEMHDLVYDLAAGEPFHLSFVADVPGIFEVEVHSGHASFGIEVRD